MFSKALILIISVTLTACGQNSKKVDTAEIASLETTYYFIRHAEKDLSDPSNRDPKLTEEGETRSLEWKEFFADKDIDAVYSTNYERTIHTALPTANALDLLIEYYEPTDLNSEHFQKATLGKNVLVVGHSNTAPFFVNEIIGEDQFSEIDESEYGHLYIVTVKDGVATASHKEFN